MSSVPDYDLENLWDLTIGTTIGSDRVRTLQIPMRFHVPDSCRISYYSIGSDCQTDGPWKGTAIERVTDGMPPFEFLKKEENQQIARYFNEAMTSYLIYSGQPIINAVDFSRFNKILNIAGGLGALSSDVLDKYPTIQQCISFDLPNVIEQSEIGNEFAKRNISKDRYEFVGGDMFDAKTIPQADAYILKSIIHDWSDDRAIDILKSIRTA